MNKIKIRTGDKVRVISGSSKGKDGVVLQVLPKLNAVVVEGLNIVKRAKKAVDGSSSGIEEVTMPINVSKVAVLNAQGKTTRLGYKIEKDGKKVRIDRKSGKEI